MANNSGYLHQSLQGELSDGQKMNNEEMQYVAMFGHAALEERRKKQFTKNDETKFRDEVMKAVLTGIYANPNRVGTCVDAVKTAYEAADAALIQRLL